MSLCVRVSLCLSTALGVALSWGTCLCLYVYGWLDESPVCLSMCLVVRVCHTPVCVPLCLSTALGVALVAEYLSLFLCGWLAG